MKSKNLGIFRPEERVNFDSVCIATTIVMWNEN